MTLSVEMGDVVVLATDGVWDNLDARDVAEVLRSQDWHAWARKALPGLPTSDDVRTDEDTKAWFEVQSVLQQMAKVIVMYVGPQQRPRLQVQSRPEGPLTPRRARCQGGAPGCVEP